MATLKENKLKPPRWDTPFGNTALDDLDINRILDINPFKDMNEEKFPRHLPLRDIIRYDTRILNFTDGELIVREGDYGNSAFIILEGSIKVILPPGLPEDMLGRNKTQRKSLFQAIGQLWSNAAYPEVDCNIETEFEGEPGKIFLDDISSVIEETGTVSIPAGNMIGENAALSRSQRNASIISEGNSQLLELRWQGLRDIRQWAKEFKLMVDKQYRERNLSNYLRSIPLFTDLSAEQFEQVTNATVFETYGEFEWYTSFNKAVANKDFSSLIDKEPLIIQEGAPIEGIFLVRSGFVRVSYEENGAHKTSNYLSKGTVYGLNYILGYSKAIAISDYSLRALGYTDILFIPAKVVEDYILPVITLPENKKVLDSYLIDWLRYNRTKLPEGTNLIDPGLMEQLVEKRYINGTSTMMIDLNRCTRCDECVKACAKGHNNNPRFIRHGTVYKNYMVANACMQCQDPVCMIGCPTGAIHRSLEGVININPNTCIGCATCAKTCPYDNIRMVDIRCDEGKLLKDEENKPVVKATKCDMCQDQLTGPACQQACPHDALIRLDLSDTTQLINWVSR